MDTASSAAVATPMAMVRILLFLCIGQLMVATLNTVEAKETKETQNRQVRTTTQDCETVRGISRIGFTAHSLEVTWIPTDGCNIDYYGIRWNPIGRADWSTTPFKTFHNITNYDHKPLTPDTSYEIIIQVHFKDAGWGKRNGPVILKTGIEGWDPMCGNDGITYDNMEALIAEKKNKPSLELDHAGACIGDCQKFNGTILGDKCLFFSGHQEKKTWEAAKTACSGKNGELVRFDDHPQFYLDQIDERENKIGNYKAYPGKYFSTTDCPDQGAEIRGTTLEGCQEACTSSIDCNAFQFKPDPSPSGRWSECDLINCNLPVPIPTGINPAYTGYSLIEQGAGFQYWVGASDLSKEGDWEWDNGVPISLEPSVFPWGHGQPNGIGDENCLNMLRAGTDLGYHDYPCSYEQPYICEIGCLFHGVIYPPGTFIEKACAQLQCDGTTGRFTNLGYYDHCQTCTAWGDPHIIPYDSSSSYTTHKAGNCSLSWDESSNPSTNAVYGEFVICGSDGVTCLGNVTFKNDEDTALTCSFDIDLDSYKMKLQVNGETVDIDALTPSPSLVKVGDNVYPVLAWTSSYVSLITTSNDNGLHIQSCLSLQGSSGILVQFCGDHSTWYANSVNIWALPETVNGLKGFCGTSANGNRDEFCTSLRFNTKEISDSFTLARKTTTCETNSSLPDVFQSQCENAVLNGVFTAHTNLEQSLIDACVFDLCRVSDPEQWLGSVHASMPKHHETKEKTVGHCKHKRTHKCKNHNGICILKTENCDGTIIDRGCHGKKCICCAPNPCDQTSKCLAKEGKCILRKDWAGCDGNVNTELCSGSDCACCYPKAPNKVKERKQCLKVKGKCMFKKKWKNCDGKLKRSWCKGKYWACCYSQ